MKALALLFLLGPAALAPRGSAERIVARESGRLRVVEVMRVRGTAPAATLPRVWLNGRRAEGL